MHFDLETDDVQAEVKRLESPGATRWDHQQERGYDFWVLRDPWDNEFCVLQTEFPELLALRRTWTTQPTAEHSTVPIHRALVKRSIACQNSTRSS